MRAGRCRAVDGRRFGGGSGPTFWILIGGACLFVCWLVGLVG